MVRALRRSGLVLALPALVGLSTVLQWLAGRRLTGLWIMPDEAVYGERALDLWRHGRMAILHGEGAGYGFLYPALAGAPLSVGRLATGYASLKLLQALAMSLVAVPGLLLRAPVHAPGIRAARGGTRTRVAADALRGLVMTEVMIYPVGAFALLAIARAIETATLRHQAIAFAAIVAAHADEGSGGCPDRDLRRRDRRRAARRPGTTFAAAVLAGLVRARGRGRRGGRGARASSARTREHCAEATGAVGSDADR